MHPSPRAETSSDPSLRFFMSAPGGCGVAATLALARCRRLEVAGVLSSSALRGLKDLVEQPGEAGLEIVAAQGADACGALRALVDHAGPAHALAAARRRCLSPRRHPACAE